MNALRIMNFNLLFSSQPNCFPTNILLVKLTHKWFILTSLLLTSIAAFVQHNIVIKKPTLLILLNIINIIIKNPIFFIVNTGQLSIYHRN